MKIPADKKSKDIELPNKKELIRASIQKTQADIYISELKERFWLRRAIAGIETRQAEQMAGLQQADQRKMKDWLVFLEEVEKEE